MSTVEQRARKARELQVDYHNKKLTWAEALEDYAEYVALDDYIAITRDLTHHWDSSPEEDGGAL